ncbi:WD40 repeat, partial [Candidatus Electrothrix aarhusensis]
QVPLWEFDYPDAAENERVEEILGTLSEARLIVGNDNEDGDDEAEPYVEAAHDELIVAWDKLFEWRDKEGEKMLLHRQLTRAAADWKRGESEKERKALLWDNSPRLLRVQEFLEQKSFGDTEGGTEVKRKQGSFRLLRQFCKNLFPSFAPLDQHVWLNQSETDFVRRSVERKRNWTRGVTISIMIIFMALATAGIVTWVQKLEADKQRENAKEQTIKAKRQLSKNYRANSNHAKQTNDTLAVLHYNAKAARASVDKNEINNLLFDTLFARKHFLFNIIYNDYPVHDVLLRDESKILTWEDDDGQAKLWDVSSGIMIRTYGSFSDAIFNGDGTRILTWGYTNGDAKVLDTQSGSIISTVRHDEDIEGAIFNSDGGRILTWGDDETARLWNTDNGSIILKLPHNDSVKNARFNNDETRILTWSDDKTTKLWDADTGRMIGRPIRHDGAASFSNDGSKILTWSKDNTARLWNTDTGIMIGQQMRHDDEVKGAIFEKDGTKVLTWSKDNTTRVWNANTGTMIRQQIQHDSAIISLSFSNDGSKFLTWNKDNTARIWNTNTDTMIGQQMRHNDAVNGARFNKNGTKVLTWSKDKTARIWNADTGTMIGQQMRHNDAVNGARFNKDENRILTWSGKRRWAGGDATVRLWNVDAGVHNPKKYIDQNVRVSIVRFNSKGDKIFTWSYQDKSATLWDKKDFSKLWSQQQDKNIIDVRFNKEGNRISIWSDDNVLSILNAKSGFLIKNIQYPESIKEARFNKDGTRIFTLNNDRDLSVVNVSNAKIIGEPMQHRGEWPPELFIFNNNESIAATVDLGIVRTANIWRIKDNNLMSTISLPPYNSNDFGNFDSYDDYEPVQGYIINKDGSKIVTWTNKVLRIWDVASGDVIGKLMLHKQRVSGARFNNYGNKVLSWGGSEVKLWNASDSGQVGITMNHGKFTQKAIFNKDETIILTWGGKEVKLWTTDDNTTIGEPMLHDAEVKGAQFNSDETKILTWSDDGTARLWNINVDYDFPPEHLSLFVEVATGTMMDDFGNIRVLTAQEWKKRKARYIRINEEHVNDTCQYKNVNFYLQHHKPSWNRAIKP